MEHSETAIYSIAAAAFLMGSKRYEHITPVLATLHWLPVSFRIDFSILLLVFKALKGQAPIYITELLIPYQPDLCGPFLYFLTHFFSTFFTV